MPHSLYRLFPPLSPAAYAELKTDIAARGVLVPVELDEEGTVLDGHHRMQIWHELRAEGVRMPEYPRIIRTGLSSAEKRSHVRALNLYRRHLTPAERRAVIAEQLRDTPGASNRQLAKVLGISDKTVAAERSRLEATAEIPQLAQRVGTDGKPRPAHRPTVIAKTAQETRRALTAIASLPLTSLPSKVLEVRRVERLARVEQSRKRAAAVVRRSARLTLGAADLRYGDFRQVLADVTDGTVTLILTDPPYGAMYLPLWADLGREARRLLKPGGVLVAYAGGLNLPEKLQGLAAHLQYVWTVALVWPRDATPIHPLRVYSRWKPALVFVKPPYRPTRWLDDVHEGPQPEKDFHEWQQEETGARHFIEAFSEPGDLVVDPFLGAGTSAVAAMHLGRRFLGCDVDAAAIGATTERLEALGANATAKRNGGREREEEFMP